MSRSETAPIDGRPTSARHFIARIREAFPDLPVRKAEPAGGGQYNVVFAVDGRWIFRFPKHAIGGRSLAREVEVLKAVHGRVPLPTPNPTFVHVDDARPARSLMGYARLPGTTFTRSRAAALDGDDLQVIAREIVGFLDALHSLPIPGVLLGTPRRGDGGPPAMDVSQWGDLLARSERHIFPHLDLGTGDAIRDRFRAFLDNPANHALPAVLVHGDPGAENFLLDDTGKHLAGVMDFGSAELNDPALDYAAASTIDPRILAMFVRAQPSVTAYLTRIRFYRSTYALQEALYGAEAGDEQAFRAGMARLPGASAE